MAMGNIIKYLRFVISQIPPDESEADAKSHLVEKLNLFLEERIVFAQDSICTHCADIIRDNDVIVTFGSSPLVRALLVRARETRTFRVIVIDSMPRWDGLHTLQRLVGSAGEEEDGDSSCVYTSMAGAAAAMKEATRVILGASALLSNGTLVAPAGVLTDLSCLNRCICLRCILYVWCRYRNDCVSCQSSPRARDRGLRVLQVLR
jgi:translation initiation factor eIF-2B subunit delta